MQKEDLIFKFGPSWKPYPVLYLDLHPNLISLGLSSFIFICS